jgi:hypothetical protein
MPSFRTARTLALLTVVTTSSGLAQTSYPDAPPAATSDAAKQEAARRFEHAVKLYEDADYTVALAEFERVYELMPDYRVLYNIGQVNIQLGRYARAFRTLKEYTARGRSEIPSDRRAAVAADLEQLSGRVARISVTVDQPGAEVSIDGTLVGKAPLVEPLVVDVGERTLRVSLAGYTPQTRSITLAGGDSRDSSFVLEREAPVLAAATPMPAPAPSPFRPARPTDVPPPARASRTWIGWTSTGALAAGAVVAGVLGASAASDLEKLRGTAGATRPQLDQAQSRAETRLLVADLLAASAVVCGGVTLYFQLARPSSSSKARATAPLELRFTASNVSLTFEH